jgi:hypothetical protein
MRLELINTRSTILPRSQFALHHHRFRERDSNHASTDPKSIVLPLDDPGIKLAVAKAMAGKVGEGRIEHPRHLSTAFTERPASTYGLLSGIFVRLRQNYWRTKSTCAEASTDAVG